MTRRTIQPGIVAMALVSLLAVAGCYVSKVPLSDSPDVTVNKSWLGTWVTEDDQKLIVYAFDEYQYVIDIIGDDGEHQLHRAFATTIEGETILSMRNLKSDQWFFVRVNGAGDTWEVAALHKDAIDQQFDTPQALREAVAEVIGDEDAFADPLTFTRRKQPSDDDG